MPYIDKKKRSEAKTRYGGPQEPGELNYLITRMIIRYVERNGLSYQIINDIKGVLDEVADEFRRRVAEPYEDRKIEENGDVYPEWMTTGSKSA